MNKQELESRLKVTNRAIEIQVIWKKLALKSEDRDKYDWLIELVNKSIAGLTEYKLDLKNMLKGNGDLSANEKLRFLITEIERTEDPDKYKFYSEKLVKLTKAFLQDGLLEVLDEQS